MNLLKYTLIRLAIFVTTLGSLLGISYGQTNESLITESVNKTGDYRIIGRVVNENNIPIAGVKVHSMITDRPPRGRVVFSITNEKGEFVLRNVERGNNAVFTSKEEDGYADNRWSFMATSMAPQVTVDEQQPEAQVEIKLGQKSPRLTGNIIDARTNKPVNDARIIMCLADDSKNCFSTSVSEDGVFNLLATIFPFTLKVTSATHKDWEYQNGSVNEARLLKLAGEATHELKITLDPK